MLFICHLTFSFSYAMMFMILGAPWHHDVDLKIVKSSKRPSILGHVVKLFKELHGQFCIKSISSPQEKHHGESWANFKAPCKSQSLHLWTWSLGFSTPPQSLALMLHWSPSFIHTRHTKVRIRMYSSFYVNYSIFHSYCRCWINYTIQNLFTRCKFLSKINVSLIERE